MTVASRTIIELKKRNLERVMELSRRREFIFAAQVFFIIFCPSVTIWWVEGFGIHVTPFIFPLLMSGLAFLIASIRVTWYGLMFVGYHIELQQLEDVQEVMES